MRILMITTSNGWDDTRLFWLESLSLMKLGLDVTILAVNSRADVTEQDGVNILALGRKRRRIGRFVINPTDAIKFCKEHGSSYDVLHIHDPEMLPWLRKIKG